jgi:ABC-type transport system substrate-binding protein
LFKPAVREIEWQIIKDQAAATQRLLKGDLDGTTLSSLEYKELLRDAKPGEGVRNPRFATKPYTKAEFFYVGWNCRLPIFADKKVRHALAQAIDRKSVVDSVYFGAAPLVDGPVPVENPLYDKTLPPVKFDLEAASRELDAAGWKDSDADGVLDKKIDDKKIDFRFALSSFAQSSEADAFCAIVKDDFKKIGIDVKVVVLPWGELQKAMREHRVEAWYGTWSTSYELDFGKFESKNNADGGSNYGSYSNPELDALSVEYEHAFDFAKQQKIANRIQTILRDDPPYAFTLRRERMTVYPSHVDGVEYSPVRPQLLSIGWYEKN